MNKSKKNILAGMFSANSLGSLQRDGTVDLARAKETIRHRRRVLSGDVWREERVADEAMHKKLAEKKWWDYRKDRKTIVVEGKSGSGKLGGRPGCYWVEFPDGKKLFLPRDYLLCP